ncbi:MULTISPECIES: citrate synthase [unclassified Luteococcus]|uniref:citrate synthase n=1 Tax=unclassified Luteococcus TaxID=2639923 RepID=UPI00313BF391
MTNQTAQLTIDGKTYDLPIVTGSMGEQALDISRLRAETGLITLDDGYGNTGSCRSAITFIDGEKGILRYRGVPIEQLAEGKSSFVETAWLVIFGQLPTQAERDHFSELLAASSALHPDMSKHFDAFPESGHPMAIMNSMINAMSTHTRPRITDEESFLRAAAHLMSKVRTIAAASYKSYKGEPLIYPRHDLKYVENLLHMMFSLPYKNYEPTPEEQRALNLFFVLHADHEQNCSTSTVRMVASSQANLYTACSAGVAALWGPRHGGANMAAVQMLRQIHESGMSTQDYVARVKDKSSGIKLQGFGHRVYRNFDPRSRILKTAVDDLLRDLEIHDPLLEIALELEEVALQDPYFVERKLYPNVDFYSGILLRALNIPLNMFTVMFAIGRMPGWIANWKEVTEDPSGRIYRPRQVYVGPEEVRWVPRYQRGK